MSLPKPAGPKWPTDAAQEDETTDNGHAGKYFHFMLNIADDDLDPYEYRLLGHYRRVCGLNGKCTQSVRDIAKVCKMSRGMVTKTREKLAAGGWITAQRVTKDGADQGYIVALIDRMKDNAERYSDKAKGVHTVDTPCPPHEQGVHQVKQRINKNKNQQIKDSRAQNQARASTPQSYAETSGKSDDELIAERTAVEALMAADDDRRMHKNEQRVLLAQAVTYLFKVSGPRAAKYVAMLEGRPLLKSRETTTWNEAAAYLKGAPVSADELIAWSDWYRKTTLGGSKDATLTSSPEKLVSSILAYRDQNAPRPLSIPSPSGLSMFKVAGTD